MSATPAEMMKEYVNSQNFSSTTKVTVAMKEMFKDVLQQITEMVTQKNDKTTAWRSKGKDSLDRNGEYVPQIIEKYNRNADGIEEKILSLYSCGMSQRDIAEQIKSLYDVEISPGLQNAYIQFKKSGTSSAFTVP